MLSQILALLEEAPDFLSAGTAALASVKSFLASDIGQKLEADLSTLFTHTSTPGSAVVVEPREPVGR